MSAASASSAPARSIEATARSTSRRSITSEIGIFRTSTSNIDVSIVSGFSPWLMVRFPCGSRSIRRTRYPISLKATPRLRVVVVLATPPFWFASAITRVPVAARGAGRGTKVGAVTGGVKTAASNSSSAGWSTGGSDSRPVTSTSGSTSRTGLWLRETERGRRRTNPMAPRSPRSPALLQSSPSQ